MFSAAVSEAAKAHALSEYPKEACGIVKGPLATAVYVPLPNIAIDPLENFQLPASTLLDEAPVLGVVHSHCHPKHEQCPTAADMQSQIASALPFGIVWTDGKAAGVPLWFGDFLLDQPLFDAKGNHIPRQFMHGVTDCYSLIRTWYWQERKVKLPEFPRDNDWWKAGGDLYEQNFAKAGWSRISASEPVKVGDALLMRFGRIGVPFHAGVMIGNSLMLHHLGGARPRLSTVTPYERYVASATHFLRHESTQ